MMKRLLLGILFSLAASAAHAACPSTLELQDANGVKAAAKYTDDGSGNCMPNVVIGPSVTSTIAITGSIPAGTNAIGSVTLGTGTNTIGSVGLSSSTQTIGFVSNDPCAQSVKSNAAISATTATVQVVAGVSAKKVYMCSLSLIANALVTVSVIEGTGSLCTTAAEAAVIGSTVATAGLAFTTNGGLTLGNGGSTVGFTGTAANGLCILQNLTTAVVSGNLTYVQQ